jgi:hypothetical protein
VVRRKLQGARSTCDASPDSFLVDAAIKSSDELSCLGAEGVTYFEEGSEGDGSARLDLLPVACRKTQRNHVFLSISPSLAETLYSGSESTKEFAFVNHS